MVYLIKDTLQEDIITAHWLDKTFFGFDRAIFAFMHSLKNGAGGFFNGFCKFVSFFGESGWAFILFAFIMLWFKKTRRHGLGMAIALVFGALITNIILKNAVDRVRPFNNNPEFYDWWQAAGSNPEDSPSFPSGHTTAAFASMVALFISADKRYSWAGLLFAALMGFSRIYLIVHYPTDVLAGLIVGTCAGIGGALLTKLIYNKACGKFKNMLYEFSIVTLIRRLSSKKSTKSETGKSECLQEENEHDAAPTEQKTEFHEDSGETSES